MITSSPWRLTVSLSRVFTGLCDWQCAERKVVKSWRPISCCAAACIASVSSGRATCHDSPLRSEEHTSELQSLMRISYAVICLKKKRNAELQTEINNTSLTTPIYTRLYDITITLHMNYTAL